GLPMLATVGVTAAAVAGIWRTWQFPEWGNYLLAAILMPWVGLVIFTVAPLPCAVFAWQRANGQDVTVRECFAWCRRRSGRLLRVMFRLAVIWFLSLILAGIPLIVLWPRTCLTPLVALFEDERRIFRRSRRILREDIAIYVLGGLFLG